MIFLYEPIEPEAIPVFPVYLLIALFAWTMTILLFMKWKKRQMRPPFLLFLTFLSLAVAISVLSLGLGEALITSEKREIYRFSLAFAYSSLMVANIFLFLFMIFTRYII